MTQRGLPARSSAAWPGSCLLAGRQAVIRLRGDEGLKAPHDGAPRRGACVAAGPISLSGQCEYWAPAAAGESSKPQLKTQPDSHFTSNRFRTLPSGVELQRAYVCCDFQLQRKRDGGTDWTYRSLNSGVVLTRAVSAAGVTEWPFPRLSEQSGLGAVPLAWHCRAGRGHKATLLCTVEKRQHRHLWSDQRPPEGPPAWRSKPAEVAKVGDPGQGGRALQGVRD